MARKILWLAFAAIFVAASATAQVTGSGTSGVVPVFTGTTYPYSKLDVNDTASSTIGSHGIIVNNSASATYDYVNIWNYSPHVYAIESADEYTYRTLALQPDGGNVGIGTTSPGAPLEVNGAVKLTAGSGASMTFQDGTIQSTAWNGTLTGGDYAESVDVGGDRSQYEPGDVLVIDPASEGKFLKSAESYSTAVMGIYSTKPGLVGRRQKTDRSHMQEEVPMAMVGVVPTKVCLEGGPIKPGDLLVTSSKPGYAMKGADRSQLTGAIIGKALGHLDGATGVIEVAVSIQ